MTTKLKFAALSLGFALALAGATGASAHSRWDAGRDYHGPAEVRMERHHHRFAERRHDGFTLGPHAGR